MFAVDMLARTAPPPIDFAQGRPVKPTLTITNPASGGQDNTAMPGPQLQRR